MMNDTMREELEAYRLIGSASLSIKGKERFVFLLEEDYKHSLGKYKEMFKEIKQEGDI